jgi:hypothetical protein
MFTHELKALFWSLVTRLDGSAFCVALIIGIATVSMPTIVPAATIAIAEKISVETSDWWQEIPSPFANTKELIGGRAGDGTMQARASITTIRHSSDEAAIARLQREAKLVGNARALQISGRPAIRLTDQIQLERRLQNLPPVVLETQQITTLIAVDSLVLKIVVTLANKAAPDSLKKAIEFASFTHISNSLSPGKLDSAIVEIERAIATKPQNSTSPGFFANGIPRLFPLTTRSTESSTPVIAAQRGELEVAVSNDATDIVIGTNSGTVFSNNGGTSWSANQALPNQNVAGVNFQRRGDPSVGRAPSGRFFLSYLGREGRGGGSCTAAGADCRDTVSVAISEPADRGDNFNFRSNAAICDPNADPFGTDQPHLVIARQPSALDREVVYIVWRRSVPNDAETSASCADLGAAHFVTQLSCSQDGGQTWTRSIKIDDRGRHPRLGVSRSGRPYVIAVRSSSGGAIDLTRASHCADGLAIDDDFPVVVDNFGGVACPVPGLDRCNTGNTLTSPTVSPDTGRELTIFASFATRTEDGNENIVARASEDGGLTFPVSAIVNDRTHRARRFMPWSCAVSGGVYVGWYDREVATAAENDLTRYHAAFLQYRPDNILATTESFPLFRAIDLSRGAADAQCSLWPSSPRNLSDSESCSRQPQQAGRVPGADGTCNAPGPGRCDFSDSATATPSLNCCLGLGSPKYGDYNGIACAGQRAFVAWASATAPAGVPAPPANSMGTYFAVVDHAETITTLCPGSGEDCIDLGRGQLDYQCPDELCDIRVPVPKLCEKVINCPICDRNWQCIGTDALVFQGLASESKVKLVDEHGRVLQEASSAVGSPQRMESLRKLFGSTEGARGLTLELRVKMSGGEGAKKQSVKITGER